MIISEDSPLRRFPSNSENKQTLFFDGIRYSIEMAAVAYARLQQTLHGLTLSCIDSSTPLVDFTPAVLDAWSIVDCVHRLRILLHKTPRLKKGTPEFQVFDRTTAEIEYLRNFIQHIDNNAQHLVGTNTPVWGTLSWFATLDTEHKSGFTCVIVAGTIFQNMDGLLINPLGKPIHSPIDLITLTANGYSICLSDIMRQVEKMTRAMENGLKEQTKDFPRTQGDVLACAEVVFGEPEKPN